MPGRWHCFPTPPGSDRPRATAKWVARGPLDSPSRRHRLGGRHQLRWVTARGGGAARRRRGRVPSFQAWQVLPAPGHRERPGQGHREVTVNPMARVVRPAEPTIEPAAGAVVSLRGAAVRVGGRTLWSGEVPSGAIAPLTAGCEGPRLALQLAGIPRGLLAGADIGGCPRRPRTSRPGSLGAHQLNGDLTWRFQGSSQVGGGGCLRINLAFGQGIPSAVLPFRARRRVGGTVLPQRVAGLDEAPAARSHLRPQSTKLLFTAPRGRSAPMPARYQRHGIWSAPSCPIGDSTSKATSSSYLSANWSPTRCGTRGENRP
jgi:hypothetical protein